MAKRNPVKKVCSAGHTFYKSSDCPVCPVCEENNKNSGSFMDRLSAPARRALQHHSINTLKDLSGHSQKEILSFHGMGPASIPILQKLLSGAGLSFREPTDKG